MRERERQKERERETKREREREREREAKREREREGGERYIMMKLKNEVNLAAVCGVALVKAPKLSGVCNNIQKTPLSHIKTQPHKNRHTYPHTHTHSHTHMHSGIP